MIELRVSEPDPIILEAEEQDQASLAVLEAFVSGGDIPAYTGSYNVTPTQSQQTLETNGKKMVRDVKVAPIPSQYIIPEGTLEVTQNGQQSVREYENVNVNVPAPTGEKTINVTQNGTTTEDVANYATAKVVTNVPASAVDSGTKNINANGTHNVVGYASAAVNVPNSYSASDEGKVVSNGALVSQSSQTVTENGTYDTTTKNEVVVNVSGGGGGGVTKIASGTATGNSGSSLAIAIGKKMAQRDFMIRVWVNSGTTMTPQNGTERTWVWYQYFCNKNFAHYDLSTNGNNKLPINELSYPTVGSDGETITTRTPSPEIVSSGGFVRMTTQAVEGIGTLGISRTDDGFTVSVGKNSQYIFQNGITYNWEIWYYGSDQTNDIVEVA